MKVPTYKKRYNLIQESEIEFIKIALKNDFTIEEMNKYLRRTKSYTTRLINKIKKGEV